MPQEEEKHGIPEWVVTFGDMMSLLLTFFIMMVSMSEIKEEEKYQALVESVQRQFGHDASAANAVPGHARPRNSALKKLATMGLARRLATMKGGDKVQAPVGDHSRVRIVRPGTKTVVGTKVHFQEGTTELTKEHHSTLKQLLPEIEGKPQKIQIRGHTSQRPVTSQTEHRDHWDLAYHRCRETMEFLVDKLKIDAKRIRLSIAGPYEPVHIGRDEAKLLQNPRVEVYLLDEVVSDLVGTAEERQKRFSGGDQSP